ncbi:BRO family protein [Candidatus Symbiopectobacterium sp.]|uniref:BRO-N domain-containing protein n=1 Tax=Candidatus Symbiopectobacterium sp. TaxID=2816440 RepID=UPI0025C24B96|nr:BRO family protein [Candidatus Symbiopectobacterium sp.]
MTTQLVFKSRVLDVVEHNSELWFTSAELAKALQYKKTDAITQIYTRNLDEFTAQMSTTLNLRVVRKTGTVEMNNRIFSLRGAHLIAMFANTPIAKEFRKWVLDILDREVGQHHPVYQHEAPERFTNTDTRNLARLVWCITRGFRFEQAWTNAVYYALRDVTGTPSPMPFEVQHIPLLAKECRRIYYVTETLRETIHEAEKQTLKRILRKREDANTVLAEMKQLFERCHRQQQRGIADRLDHWHEDDVKHFLTRH